MRFFGVAVGKENPSTIGVDDAVGDGGHGGVGPHDNGGISSQTATTKTVSLLHDYDHTLSCHGNTHSLFSFCVLFC